MKRAMEQKLTAARHRLALLSGQLHGLSPLAKISNGYGFVMDAEENDSHPSARPQPEMPLQFGLPTEKSRRR